MTIYGKDLTEVLLVNDMKLKERLKKVKLDPQAKEIVLLAMEFGYAAAHSSRTYSLVHQTLNSAQRCDDTYHAMEKMIEKKETS